MVKKQAPTHTYKALLWDYDALAAMSDQECCYSLSEREIGLLLAVVDYIGWKTRYKPTDTEIDQSLILQWQGNLARKLMSGCCPDDGQLSRFTSDGVYQTSDDGGETWQDNPNADPRNQATRAPLLGGSGDSTKCAAADNARDTFKAYKAQLRSLLEAGTTVLAIVAGLIGALGVLLGLTGVALPVSVLLFGMAAALLSLTPEELDAALTDTVFNQFRCILYCHIEDNGEFSYAGWQAVIDEIDTTFTGFPQQFFHSIVAAMGYIGLTNAGTIGEATADDCGDCGCDDTWCYTWLDTQPQGDWAATSRDDGSVTTFGGGKAIGGGTTDGQAMICDIFLAVTGTVTHIEFDYEYNRTNPGGGTNTVAIIVQGVESFFGDNLTGSGTGTFEANGEFTDKTFQLVGGVFSATGTMNITRILMRGNGTNPFGVGNCP